MHWTPYFSTQDKDSVSSLLFNLIRYWNPRPGLHQRADLLSLQELISLAFLFVLIVILRRVSEAEKMESTWR